MFTQIYSHGIKSSLTQIDSRHIYIMEMDLASSLIMHMGRKKIGIKDLAAKLGVTERTIINYRNRKFKPRCDKAIKMAEILGLTHAETETFLRTISRDCFEKEYLLTRKMDEWAATIFPDFTEDLLNRMPTLRPPVVLLLNQAGWDEPPCREALLMQAKKRYSPDNVVSIFPPFCTNDNVDSYFGELAKQCHFDNVTDQTGFEQTLKQRLKSGKNIFLLIGRFEQIPNSILQREFAGIIRSASEEFKNMHAILCGGQKLEGLKFQGGALSLLNSAELRCWPELRKTEVQQMCHHAFKRISLTEGDIEAILKISGGHPQLLKCCLTVKHDEPALTLDKYDDYLREPIWPFFTPYREDETTRKQVLSWLGKEDLGGATPFILNDLLRELYWKNLLVKRNGRLCWRCEAIRSTGKSVLH